MGMMKRTLSLALVFCLMLSALFVNAPDASAATARLNKKAVTLRIGKSTKLKVRGTTSKITWRSAKQSVASVSSDGTVTAKKLGTTKIYAKFSGKKLYCDVTVTGSKNDTKAGGILNPLSAYDENTINYYEDGKKIGTFTIKLEDFQSGQAAKKRVLQNPDNPVPTNTQEYLYFRFQIQYVSGSGVIPAKDLFSYHYNIFDSSGTTQLQNIDWGFYFELVEDLSDITLTPGISITCSKAVLVNKGNTPVLYRIQTGKNSYTWFTTKK